MAEDNKPKGDEAKKDEGKKAERKVKVKDTVKFVTVRDGALDAEVTKVHPNGTVDLEIAGTGQVITNSPNDPAGKVHDSWNFAE